ncbi:DUF1801 domain-containing protein [Labilibacter marinus]|uniref:DUF1801 domain-containing protein n=1 Tax=Labilibacter marinus TaxID=1477105 RepID=UPI00094FEB05|nr:DUF1801 domain-containing protein [Labilibacter marinus]
MKIQAHSPEEYINQLPDDRKEAVIKLRKVILENIPDGFKEEISYGMIGYVVPHSLYPAGYHCDPKLPLPFTNIASQKNFVALYHSGIYADKEIHDWFVQEYPKHCKYKMDMGKSCVRFKKMNDIPYELIAQLMQKMSSQEWIDLYEKNIKR